MRKERRKQGRKGERKVVGEKREKERRTGGKDGRADEKYVNTK